MIYFKVEHYHILICGAPYPFSVSRSSPGYSQGLYLIVFSPEVLSLWIHLERWCPTPTEVVLSNSKCVPNILS